MFKVYFFDQGTWSMDFYVHLLDTKIDEKRQKPLTEEEKDIML